MLIVIYKNDFIKNIFISYTYFYWKINFSRSFAFFMHTMLETGISIQIKMLNSSVAEAATKPCLLCIATIERRSSGDKLEN